MPLPNKYNVCRYVQSLVVSRTWIWHNSFMTQVEGQERPQWFPFITDEQGYDKGSTGLDYNNSRPHSGLVKFTNAFHYIVVHLELCWEFKKLFK